MPNNVVICQHLNGDAGEHQVSPIHLSCPNKGCVFHLQAWDSHQLVDRAIEYRLVLLGLGQLRRQRSPLQHHILALLQPRPRPHDKMGCRMLVQLPRWAVWLELWVIWASF